MTSPVEPNDPIDPSLAMTIEDVCRLAWDYRTVRNASARELITRSGYLVRRGGISVGLLEDTLRQHPDWVDAWIEWSEDKRVDSGWYIARHGASAFDVGDWPAAPPVRYGDRTRACAVFVHHELASIADVEPLPE